MENKTIEKSLNNIADKLDTLITLLSGGAVPSSAAPCAYSFYEWIDEWFTIYKAPRLSDKGYQLQLSINKWIKPNIADMPLNKVNSLDIVNLINLIPYTRTKQIVRCQLNQIFSQACKLKLIKDNPVDCVDKTRHAYKNGRSLLAYEQKEFLKKIKLSKYEQLFRFYLLTGCRRSEALSIQWTDIKGKLLHIPGTKTHKSDRNFPIYDELAELIDKIPKDKMRLFPYSARAVEREFDRVRSTLSFQDITIKDLRHTFSSNCRAAGFDLKIIQTLLGHSTILTTANIYTHVSDDILIKEIKKLDSKKPLKKG